MTAFRETTHLHHGATQPGGQNEPRQTFGTADIAPMARPSLTARFFMAVVAMAERLNLKHSKVGNPPVYDNATFPWVAEIEREWPLIRTELDRVLLRQAELPSFHDISTDVQTIRSGLSPRSSRSCGSPRPSIPGRRAGRSGPPRR